MVACFKPEGKLSQAGHPALKQMRTVLKQEGPHLAARPC